MSHPVEINDANFEELVLKSDVPVLLDFWAEWCSPCRMIAPVVEELAGEYEGKIKVGKVDVDSNPGISSKYQIRSIPSLVIFKNGEVDNQIIGAVPKGQIKDMMEKSLV